MGTCATAEQVRRKTEKQAIKRVIRAETPTYDDMPWTPDRGHEEAVKVVMQRE
jgi:hypothetical protein